MLNISSSWLQQEAHSGSLLSHLDASSSELEALESLLDSVRHRQRSLLGQLRDMPGLSPSSQLLHEAGVVAGFRSDHSNSPAAPGARTPQPAGQRRRSQRNPDSAAAPPPPPSSAFLEVLGRLEAASAAAAAASAQAAELCQALREQAASGGGEAWRRESSPDAPYPHKLAPPPAATWRQESQRWLAVAGGAV